MKTIIRKTFFVALLVTVVGFGLVMTTVNASSIYDSEVKSFELVADVEYSLEEMLTYAIQDEYLAQAEYELIISEFGEIRPFTNIVEAEQTHIDLLVPLFETYNIELPENNAAELTVLPESISSALATGIEAEEMNIAMYQQFLSQDNLPDDVRTAFEYLMNSSENHLRAFSKDRYNYLGTDFAQGIKNMFRKGGNNTDNGSQNRGSNINSNKGLNSGICVND
jgi:hypothetical protein